MIRWTLYVYHHPPPFLALYFGVHPAWFFGHGEAHHLFWIWYDMVIILLMVNQVIS